MFTTDVKLLDEVTADTTGAAYEIGDRVKFSVQFIAASIALGNGIFTIDVSNDGTNWVAYNRLTDNVVNGITEGDVRAASCTLSSNTSKIYFFPEGDHFKYIRANVNMTTDGKYTAVLHGVI